MIQIIKPDSEDQKAIFPNRTVFLAGSIEMGSAVDWQREVEEVFDKEIFKRNHW